MKLNKVEKRHMRRALRLAIDYDEALIDAYRIAWSKRQRGVKILSAEGRQVAAHCRRNIAAFNKLLARLDGDQSE